MPSITASADTGDTLIPSYDVDYYADEVIADQYPHLRRMRELGAVVWLPRHGNYAITRYAELRAALRNWKVFSSAYGVAADDVGCAFSAGNTLASDPPQHDKFREVSGAPLLPMAVEKYRQTVQESADVLIENLVARGSFDGVTDLSQHLPLVLVRDFVGLPEDGRENMLKWAAAGFDVLGMQNARGRAATETVKEMRAWVAEKVNPNAVVPGSWTDRLYRLSASGEIPKEYFDIIMRDYITPSLDTTITATSHLIYQLAHHPDQWRMLRENPTLISEAVQEGLRMAAPVRSTTRTTTREFEIGGVLLPKGARVMMLYPSGNRDERKFPDPDRFDIMREGKEHLSFGSGVHMCEGMHLAMMEIEALLRAMIPRVETIRVGKPVPTYNNTIHGFATMRTEFVKARVNASALRLAVARSGWFDVRVAQRTEAAEGIVSLLLEAGDGGALPPYEAGAHVDVEIGRGLVRQYSICSAPDERGRYRLGVLLDPNTRGGSRIIHSELAEGSCLRIGQPRNLFRLNRSARRSILLAGGIGITPILAMAYDLKRDGKTFELHYTARSLGGAAFIEEMKAAFGNRFAFYADDEKDAPRFDLSMVLSQAKPEDHIYCCGPGGFIDFVLEQARRAGWPEANLHVERFSATPVITGAPFRVLAQKSGLEVEVGEGQTILQALQGAGLDVPSSCESGVCGTCMCRVLKGSPDHRDYFQTDDEKAGNDRIAICCSRSLSEFIVLDI